MSYCSKVSILCGCNVANKLIGLEDLYGAKVRVRKDGLFRFFWDDVRWPLPNFESNTPADAIMNVVNESISTPIEFMKNGKLDDFCSYIRIGDEVDDNEHRNNSPAFERQFLDMRMDIMEDTTKMIAGRCYDLDHDDIKELVRSGLWNTCTR